MRFTLNFSASTSLAQRLLISWVLVAVVALHAVWQTTPPTGTPRAVWAAPAPHTLVQSLMQVGQGSIPMPAHTPAAHASALLALPPTHAASVMAFWFAGAGESAPDVQIAASQFDRASQTWSPARFVVNREQLGTQLGYGVRRIGNPTAWLDAHGRIHLFVVATGLGGWAAARIVHLVQDGRLQDLQHLQFTAVRTLPLSWLWNTSFLVRTAALTLADGGMLLPTHFELGVKYPVAVRFDRAGEFMGMTRISRRTDLLQPTFLMQNETQWLALMRSQHAAAQVGVAQTLDGGQHWHDLPDLALHNPNASIAGLALAPGQLYLAHNSSPHSRLVLDLSHSNDGMLWNLTHTLARGEALDEYSYPAMAWADDSLWVSYTDQRRSIAWQRFTLASASTP